MINVFIIKSGKGVEVYRSLFFGNFTKAPRATIIFNRA